MGTKSHRPNAGQYVDVKCICVSSQHCPPLAKLVDGGMVDRGCYNGKKETRAPETYLPKQIITQSFNATGTDQNIQRRAADFGSHKMCFDVLFCYFTDPRVG